ncbi:hypothetical protein MOVS_05190 [Moraxella ovis]|uniref:Uncharacterized protein n=1 Tax=Moraxella ovis TaxID=29433 RepID=A0A378PK04_9GAMM|nr:hypothetical protein [Moraxella ovis]ANB91473.1 hypothetical protein MOVS_05190 [Moraxella ovis]STY87091.1 Uncharacterised protein [Moraxella ovis]
MITIKELVDNLVQTELHNLKMKDSEGVLRENRLEQIINNINLGLTDLYTKFVLKVVEVKYIVEPHQRMFSPVVNTDNEILEVLSVFHNDERLFNSGFRAYTRISASNGAAIKLNYSPNEGDIIRIISKANHRRFTKEDYHDETKCELPLSYITALNYFVASRMFTSIVNQLDGDLNEPQRWYQMYLTEIKELRDAGMEADNLDSNYWFQERGFV